MLPPTLPDAEADALVEALAIALEALLQRTCPDMVPLWLEATRNARLPLNRPMAALEPSEEYLRLGKGSRSKYRVLAAWRHAVLWRGTSADEWQAAVDAVYFTPYPENRPPYAWTQAASPHAAAFPSSTTLKEHAKEGAWLLAKRLHAEIGRTPTLRAEIEADLLRAATRTSLTDVLKLEEHPRWRSEP